MAEQIITAPGGERLVILPEAEYRALIEALEDKADAYAAQAILDRIARGEEEMIPAEVVNRLIDGENKVRVWREHRSMSSRNLAEKAGISVAYLSQIETGASDGSFDTIKRIAAALSIGVDDLA